MNAFIAATTVLFSVIPEVENLRIVSLEPGQDQGLLEEVTQTGPGNDHRYEGMIGRCPGSVENMDTVQDINLQGSNTRQERAREARFFGEDELHRHAARHRRDLVPLSTRLEVTQWYLSRQEIDRGKTDHSLRISHMKLCCQR